MLKRVLLHILAFLIATLVLMALLVFDGAAYADRGSTAWMFEMPRLSFIPAQVTAFVSPLPQKEMALASLIPTPTAPAFYMLPSVERP